MNPSKGTNNRLEERIKTVCQVWAEVLRGKLPPQSFLGFVTSVGVVREAESRRLGRTTRNWVEVQRTHFLEQRMVRHGVNASELWKNLPWKKFRRELFRLQKRVYKAVSVGDKRKANYLQKLILKSKAARLLAKLISI